jgi:FkbM family methyltransferase
MKFKNRLKYLLRSRSFDFVSAMGEQAQGERRVYQHRSGPVHYRAGTSDPHLVYGILLKQGKTAEYTFPAGLAPKVILDIGANIGVTAIMMAERFPDAVIHAIEPVPDNFALLRDNAAARPRIHAYNYAMGGQDGELELMWSNSDTNYGGFSAFGRGSAGDRKFTVPAITPASFMKQNGLDRIDLIKIDTEGAESMILRAFDPAVLAQVTWITGELHGQDDFELLAYLSRWFDIGLRKNIKNRLFNFSACNKQALDRL